MKKLILFFAIEDIYFNIYIFIKSGLPILSPILSICGAIILIITTLEIKEGLIGKRYKTLNIVACSMFAVSIIIKTLFW